MKCDNCEFAFTCMNFFCNDETGYKDYKPLPPQEWQIEEITVPYNVIIPEVSK